jgi:hypothetical protein
MQYAVRRALLGASWLVICLACERSTTPGQAAPPVPSTEAAPVKKSAPATTAALLDVTSKYPDTESVGAKRRIHLDKAEPSQAHSPPEAWKIEFEKSGGFGGICWKNRPGNEGEMPGDDLSAAGYRRISFWARGETGGEVAEFRAGGLGHIKTRYRDSFDVTAGKLTMTPRYSEYSIYVSDADLSSVMTVFCVLFHREDNDDKAVIYVDDIQYRG